MGQFAQPGAGVNSPAARRQAAAAQRSSQVALAALGALCPGDQEILDLVYRRGIRPADLGAVLALPGEEAYRRLVTAEGEFLAVVTGASPGADLNDLALLPEADLPASGRHGAPRAGRSDHGAEASALWPVPTRRRRLLAAAVLVSVAAIASGVVYVAALGSAHGSRAAAGPSAGARPPGRLSGTPSPGPTAGRKHDPPPVIPIVILMPAPNQGVTLPPPLLATPAPSTPPDSPSPSPSASPSTSASPEPSGSASSSASPSDSASPTGSASTSP